MKLEDLQKKKLTDLREIAKAMNIPNYSKMKKQDLLYAIQGEGPEKVEAEAVKHTDLPSHLQSEVRNPRKST